MKLHVCRLQKAQIVAEEKAERERVRREERERRLRELAEAKRYPIEDLEHLQEQLAKAASQGGGSSCAVQSAMTVAACQMQLHSSLGALLLRGACCKGCYKAITE